MLPLALGAFDATPCSPLFPGSISETHSITKVCGTRWKVEERRFLMAGLNNLRLTKEGKTHHVQTVFMKGPWAGVPCGPLPTASGHLPSVLASWTEMRTPDSRSSWKSKQTNKKQQLGRSHSCLKSYFNTRGCLKYQWQEGGGSLLFLLLVSTGNLAHRSQPSLQVLRATSGDLGLCSCPHIFKGQPQESD